MTIRTFQYTDSTTSREARCRGRLLRWGVKLRQGVAQEKTNLCRRRRRHGRKSRDQRFDGYKRHVLRDLDTGSSRWGNKSQCPEASVTDAIATDLKLQKISSWSGYIDRAYLSSSLVQNRSDELAIYYKAGRWKWQAICETAFVMGQSNYLLP